MGTTALRWPWRCTVFLVLLCTCNAITVALDCQHCIGIGGGLLWLSCTGLIVMDCAERGSASDSTNWSIVRPPTTVGCPPTAFGLRLSINFRMAPEGR